MRQWWSKVKEWLGGRRELADELQQEIDAHLQCMIDENMERGMPLAEAVTEARRHFGNTAKVREQSYEAWRFSSFESMLQDVRYAVRGIVRAPLFFLIVIVTLAIGIGATTAIFSAVYTVLLRPLPFPSGERLVLLGESSGKASGISVTWINFEHWRSENHTFERMAAFEGADLTLTGHGQAVITHSRKVTNEYLALLGAKPIMGRLFADRDEAPQAPVTVVLSHNFWNEVLGADPQIIGKSLTLNGMPFIVIGVLARDPEFFSMPIDYYLSLQPTPEEITKRNAHESIRVLGLLKPGVSVADAQKDLDATLRRLAKRDPGPEDDHRSSAVFVTQSQTGDVRYEFVLLMWSVGLVLVLACANIAGLMLIRFTMRAREMAIRTAIGAGPRRLARQLVTETVLITFLGGACGLLLAALGLRAVKTLGPPGIPRLSEASLNLPVLTFAAMLTMLVALACALAPVLSSGKVNLSLLLKESSTGAGSGRMGHALRGVLVIAEIAAAVVLLFTTGLLLRSLRAAEMAEPGFEPGHVLALQLQLPGGRYKSDASILEYYRRLETSLRAQPEVESVGAVNCPPAAGDCGDWWYSVLGKSAPTRADVPVTLVGEADPSYFQTMRIPILAGRGPSEEDRPGGTPVAVIDEVIARAWWKNPQEAIGQHIKMGGPYMQGPVVEIVGVAGNVPQEGLDAPPDPQIYLPAMQHANGAMVVMIRTHGAPASIVPVVRTTVASMDRDVPIQSLKPLDDWLSGTLVARRFLTSLLAVFAGMAVVLAAIGCYGALNYWVSSRRQEIAIRMAMGAGTAAILRRSGGHAARLGTAGLLIGLIGCLLASRWLSNLVFGITVHDPFVLTSVAVVSAMIVLLSTALPVWRATQIDPIETLHES